MAVTELTKEQEALIPVVSNEWIQYCLRPDFDEQGVREGVEKIYALCNLNAPTTHIVDSPKSAQVLAQQLLGKKEFQSFSWLSLYWSHWVAEIDYYLRAGLLDTTKDPKLYEDFEIIRKYMRSGPTMALYYDTDAIIVRPPAALRLDNRQRLHAEQGPAVEWDDGYCQYYLHGSAFSKEEYQKYLDDTLSIDDLRNTEQRSALIQTVGIARALGGRESTLIHEHHCKWHDGRPLHYKLHEYAIDEAGTIVRAVEVQWYVGEHLETTIMGVPREEETATCMGAIAWSFTRTEEEYVRGLARET